MVRLIPTAAAVAALAACGSPPVDGKSAEALALVAALEKRVSLPDARRSLISYERYYALSADGIEAVYLPAAQGTARVHVTDRLPQPRATGCSVVNIVFDRASKRFERILCNDARLAQTEPRLPIVRADALKMERG